MSLLWFGLYCLQNQEITLMPCHDTTISKIRIYSIFSYHDKDMLYVLPSPTCKYKLLLLLKAIPLSYWPLPCCHLQNNKMVVACWKGLIVVSIFTVLSWGAISVVCYSLLTTWGTIWNEHLYLYQSLYQQDMCDVVSIKGSEKTCLVGGGCSFKCHRVTDGLVKYINLSLIQCWSFITQRMVPVCNCGVLLVISTPRMKMAFNENTLFISLCHLLLFY